MTMQTNAMRSDRNILKRLPDLREAIRAYAEEHPDKSSKRSPAELAERRARLLRLYLLAGRSQVTAVRYLEQLTGERITRQALRKQLAVIEVATNVRLLEFRRY